MGRDLREAERRGEAPERPNLPRPCRRRERRHEAMSWAAELLQITQQCDTTTSDRAAAASLDAVVAGLGAAARLELDAGLGADALAAQLLACGGGPAAGGQGGMGTPEKGAPRGAAADGGALTEETLKPPEYEVRISTSVSHTRRAVQA